MSRDKKKPPISPQGGSFNSPFAGLADKLGLSVPSAPGERSPEAKPSPAPSAGAREPRLPARAVLRLEKKGRGGKEVTVVEKLGVSPTEMGEWLKRMKAALGTGGTVEDDTLVLQGDHRERLRAWLTERGVRQISVG